MEFFDVFAGAFLAMLATSFGALLILLIRRIEGPLYSAMLAFAGGVMLFSAAEMLREAFLGTETAIVAAGLMLGFAFILVLERSIPHLHIIIRKKAITPSKKKAALISGTITLHNMPEGFAIASAFATSGPLGWLVATAIALQDIPEGFAISAPLACYGVKLRKAIWFGIFSGVVEFAAAIAGFFFLSAFAFLIPIGLSFSAGAMLFVVFVELMPDAMANKMGRVATASFIIGILAAFCIASVFGF